VPPLLSKRFSNAWISSLINLLFSHPETSRNVGNGADEVERVKKIDPATSYVIPAKAGIQGLQEIAECLDSGFHRSDDYNGEPALIEAVFSQALPTVRMLSLRAN
jgi:hypothetical protein